MLVSYIDKLQLTDFRSFAQQDIIFDSKQTLILGQNGRGKTNILEAISLLSIGKSFRGKTLSECVRMGAQVAHIVAQSVVDSEEEKISAHIVATQNNLGQRSSVRYERNGVKKQKKSVVGIIKSVVFRPEDLEIITGSPSTKRDFLDEVLIQVSPVYLTALREYERALKHRNKLILQLRDGLVTRRDFFFWDELLVKHGDLITRERARFIHFLNTAVVFPVKAQVTYDHSIMSEERLHQYATAEVAAGRTLVGPHKDSLSVRMQLSSPLGGEEVERSTTEGVKEIESQQDLQDVSLYGSRGQQRMAVLWLKVAQLQFIEAQTKQTPILLLDDIFSELDEHNRELIFSLFDNHQVIMTSAEEMRMLPPKITDGLLVNL
ncbi:hypothetical protein C5B42_03275 [Candidatus Cerribacteria bacterium 'Amazon FNV 2010 28 9']|uniref:DNA replication and repair protein RecF n=1 Tax=Candidatus Cerribacteria bacterium 'Amazon FNV 2010 28 9' TaxID=2081795 RepID=A0A317JQ30_9BACT|nr:MAG: hypothetical protein C5B42_03275 [Candidatus Cerribacteria bacterium 'Amazon FNV 2010 28 9']